MSRVFVVGAHLPRGGAYMAYHLGRIVAKQLGLDPVAVTVHDEKSRDSVFEYSDRFDVVSFTNLLDVASADDVLVCSPTLSKQLLGLRFPGRSLMYVQGVAFQVIDGYFDHYVAVSRFVRDHLALHYGWDVPVIPPFLHTDRIGEPTPWAARPPGSVLVLAKFLGRELVDRLVADVRTALPEHTLTFTTPPRTPHPELLSLMRQHRYCLALSPIEGFGLLPAEAMLSGCCVVGFHGGGGLDYLRPGVNSAVVGYPRLADVATNLVTLVRDPSHAEELADRGRADVSTYTFEAYEERWSGFIDASLRPAP